MNEQVIDEQYIAELDQEWQELKEIASAQGLTPAEYLVQEAKKLVEKQK